MKRCALSARVIPRPIPHDTVRSRPGRRQAASVSPPPPATLGHRAGSTHGRFRAEAHPARRQRSGSHDPSPQTMAAATRGGRHEHAAVVGDPTLQHFGEWVNDTSSRDAAYVLLLIKTLVAVRPTHSYRRMAALLNRQLRARGAAPVSLKRVQRILQAHNLLLARRYTGRPELTPRASWSRCT